jgi:hypothetical protein
LGDEFGLYDGAERAAAGVPGVMTAEQDGGGADWAAVGGCGGGLDFVM